MPRPKSIQNGYSKLRNREGLTQAQMARRVGVSRETIKSLEMGRLKPSADLATRIRAVGLGCDRSQMIQFCVNMYRERLESLIPNE